MDYFCVDVEASGQIPGLHNLLSIGVTHVTREHNAYGARDSLYLEMKPIFPEFEPAAMAVNGLSKERLEAEGLHPDEAMRQVVQWVEEHRRRMRDRPVFVAHNAPFDWMYFAYSCGHAKLINPFGHSALDTKAFAMGLYGIPWNQTTLKQIRCLAGIPEMDPDLMHHAGEDAKYLARVFSAMLNKAGASSQSRNR